MYNIFCAVFIWVVSVQEYQETKTLKELPEMTASQLDVVNNHLYQIVMQVGMNPADLESRRTIEVLVSDLVTSNLKGNTINAVSMLIYFTHKSSWKKEN